MITNKERLEQLIEQIKRLENLTEEVREREIYPVSFFSQAFDISNKIQDDLQQIEISQIEFIEAQIKEPVIKQSPPLFSQQEMDVQITVPPPPVKQVQEEIIVPPPPVKQVQEEKIMIPSNLTEKKKMIDLKKMITLNDHFLFCRELFSNNDNLMTQIFNDLNMEESYETAVDYLQKRFDWNLEDKIVVDFLSILKKSFS